MEAMKAARKNGPYHVMGETDIEFKQNAVDSLLILLAEG